MMKRSRLYDMRDNRSRNFRIPDRLFCELHKYAERHDMTISAVVRVGAAVFIGKPKLGEPLSKRKPRK